MAFIPGFEFDIFISYASIDDQPAPGMEKGWVTFFHDVLETKLNQRVGRAGAIKIWRAPRIEGEQFFDQTIKNAIDNSALFFALTSQGFLASEYCRQELNWFKEKAGREAYGPQIGDRSRVYSGLLNNIPYKIWQEKFGRISGHPLHDAKHNDEFGEPTNPHSKEFQQQLRKIVDSLHKMLLEFKAKLSGKDSATESLPAAIEKASIYFAEVSDSLRPTRNFVINELKQQKIKIADMIPPPSLADKHEKAVIDAIKNVRLSVHLLDQFAGREIEGAPDEHYIQKQVTLGSLHAQAQFIWMPKHLDLQTIEEAAHKQFLQQLESGIHEHDHLDFVRGSRTTLAQQILEKINKLQVPPPAASAVLLSAHQKDQSYALELSRFLLEKGVQPFINPQEDDPRKNMKTFVARIRQVSHLIVLYGSVDEGWARSQLGTALQLSVLEKHPLKTLCLYLLPPEKKVGDLNFGAIRVHFVDNSNEAKLDFQAMQQLLHLLKIRGNP